MWLNALIRNEWKAKAHDFKLFFTPFEKAVGFLLLKTNELHVYRQQPTSDWQDRNIFHNHQSKHFVLRNAAKHQNANVGSGPVFLRWSLMDNDTNKASWRKLLSILSNKSSKVPHATLCGIANQTCTCQLELVAHTKEDNGVGRKEKSIRF